jgi:4-amino-4-deoxy-L-arabinose transferase-like glycosyltransferase
MTDFPRHLRPADYALLTLLAAVLFGYGTISGKPLTMHEARLPQCSREMLATGQWLLPHSGERPWLERPPFPHWVMLAVGHLAGRLDRAWIVRIPPALMGTLTLLLVAWMGGRLLGRPAGLLSGVALATMYEFNFYAGQAEDDIFLAFLVAACMALFVATEFPSEAPTDSRRHLLGNRPASVWLFFAVAGLSSLAKGPFMGAIEVFAATGPFVLLSRDKTRILRYVWLWGWLLFAGASLAWYGYAYSVYPSLWDNLRFDFVGSTRRSPAWSYLVNILWTTAPWTPFWIAGAALLWRGARAERSGPNRFLWCWWLAPLIALSIPARKHHHYLLPILAPFAVMAAVGLQHAWAWLRPRAGRPRTVLHTVCFVALPGSAAIVALALWGKIPGPLWAAIALAGAFLPCATLVGVGLARRSGRLVLAAVLAGVTIGAGWGQSILATTGRNWDQDVDFVARAGPLAAPDKPILVDAYGTLEFFRLQFYLPPGTTPLQDLTFLRDSRLTAPQVYVVTHTRSQDFLSTLGDWRIVCESNQAPRKSAQEDRYALFLLTFKPGLERYPAPPVSVTQAMGRAPGPSCGPPLATGAIRQPSDSSAE